MTIKFSIEAWRESDFERWFAQNPLFPNRERVLLVSKHRPLKRVIDLVCLDAAGQLVIIEVKNEPTTRRTVGQALEYLANFDDASLSDIEEEYDGDLGGEFAKFFGHELKTLGAQRRVVLAAPTFDAPSALTARWLNENLASAKVTFQLLEVQRRGDSFGLSWYGGPAFVRARALAAQTAVSPRGRLYQVLEPGQRPVLWHIGRVDSSGHLRLPVGRALSKRGVRTSSRYLAPVETPPAVDLSSCGSVWRYRSGGRLAKLLGIVTDNKKQFAVFVRFRDGYPTSIRRAQLRRFRAQWEPAMDKVDSWRSVADALERQVMDAT
jgi:hypothetical protein